MCRCLRCAGALDVQVSIGASYSCMHQGEGGGGHHIHGIKKSMTFVFTAALHFNK